MSQNNFKCPETGKEFFISNFRSVLDGENFVYKDRSGSILKNPENNAILEPISRPIDWSKGKPSLITEKSKNGRGKDEKRKRSLEHFKKEIYPTLAPSDRKLYKEQHGWKE